MNSIVVQQAEKLAGALAIAGTGEELISTLKATAFKGQVSDAQMTALLIVAQQYGLSPWTKEIYAIHDRNNGIIPVVGVDGWSRIINNHPSFDGMDFEVTDEEATCIIYRKDRNHPVRVTEFMSECKRDTGPWKSHPRRMLRHKAMIQCARLAFGHTGIYDRDEAELIAESKFMGDVEVVESPIRSRAEVAKAAMSSKKSGSVKLSEVITAFNKAATDAELICAAKLADRLATEEEKITARQAFAARRDVLKKEKADQNVIEGEIIEPGEHDDFLAELDAAEAEANK